MKKLWCAVGVLALLVGCTTDSPNAVTVVDAGVKVSDKANILEREATAGETATTPDSTDQIEVFPVDTDSTVTTTDLTTTTTQPVIVSGIPSGNSATSRPLDSAVLALITTAQQQQEANKLNEAAASLERAQRIAPSEPQVLYNLAAVRLKQGDANAAEQVARQALSYTAEGDSQIRASLWEVIALAREKQGDQAGAVIARQQK